MRAHIWVVIVVLLLAHPSQAQYSMRPYFAPYRPNVTEKNLASMLRDTKDGVVFSDGDAKTLWNSMYADCSVFGIDDRYIFYDTLFRASLLMIRAFSGNPHAYLSVHSTVTGITVDSITPPYKTRKITLKVRLAVIDQSGRFLYSELTDQGVRGACQGAQGDIFVDGHRLMSGPLQ
jgi:hypothetical protein